MATLEGHELLDPGYFAGAAFRLSEPSEDDLELLLPSGSKAQIFRGSSYLTVHVAQRQAPPPEKALIDAAATAQDALDIYSVRNGIDRSIPSAHDEHLIWWKKKGRRTIRITETISSRARMNATLTVTNSDGAIRLAPPVNTSLNPAFRYFRSAQITNNLVDAYRNMYLAFESLLTSRYGGPQHDSSTGRVEGETKWLRHVLPDLNREIPLQPYVQQRAKDPVEAFFKEQYEAKRCALFHAKLGRGAILPGSFSERTTVAVALNQLGQLVSEMIERFLFVKRSSSGMSLYAMAKVGEAFAAQGLTLGVTDDDTPITRESSVVSPKGRPIVDLNTSYHGAPDGIGYEHTFIGTADASQLATMSIHSIVGHIADELIAGATIPGLVIAGFDTVEVCLIYRMRNHGDLKEDYVL